MREPPIHRALHSTSSARRIATALRAAFIVLALLVSPGCIQFQLSDGSVGIYDPGLDIFSSPAPLFRREARRRPPAAVARLRGTAIVVDKPTHRLLVYDDGRLRRRYKVALGIHSDGHKVREGDRRTPEGVYRVLAKKDRGQTRFHRALLIDYPSVQDRAIFVRAKAEGRIPKSARIGGLIEIHGGGTGFDWTDGCIALENRDMDDLFQRVGVGTPIVILGPRGDKAVTF